MTLYAAGMFRLTQSQIDKLAEQIGVRLAWLGRLRTRLEQRGCTKDDRLYVATVKAYEAMHTLRVHAMYLRPDGESGPTVEMGEQIGQKAKD